MPTYVQLCCLRGSLAGRMFAFVDPAPIPLPQPLLLGRNADCHVCFHAENEVMVSRRHGEISISPDGVRFVDNSTHGTFPMGKGERIDALHVKRGSAAEIQLGPGGPVLQVAVGRAIPCGNYSLVAKLGEGGMAEVYVAVDNRLNRFVVLKLLRPEVEVEDPLAQQSLLHEARIVAQIEHNNVVRVYELGEIGGIPFIAMEYLRGISLYQLESQLARLGKRLPPPLAAAIIRQACLGLHAAHELPSKVVHRDISHNNIIITRDGVKVIDFGIARSNKTDTRPVTAPNVTKGCPPYMSPEQISSPHLVSRTSDIFSTAVVLYELCTGASLFGRDNVLSTMGAVLHHEPPPLRTVCAEASESLEQLLQLALTKNPTDRKPTTAAEFAARLKEESGPQLLQHDAIVAELEQLGVEIQSPPPAPLTEEPALVRRALQSFQSKAIPSPSPAPALTKQPRPVPLVPEPESQDPIELAFTKLDGDWFGLDAPEEMNVGRGYVVRAGAARDLLQRGLAEYAENLREQNHADLDTLPFGRLLKLELLAEDSSAFIIRPLSPAEQPLLRNDLSAWDWLVLPQRSGEGQQIRVVATQAAHAGGSKESKGRLVRKLTVTARDTATGTGLVGLPTTGLRSLIDSLLPSRADVELFCQTNFPNIHRRFVADMERDQKVSLLLLLAAGTGIISALRSLNPQVVGLAEAQAALNASPNSKDGDAVLSIELPARGGSFECKSAQFSRLFIFCYDLHHRDPIALPLELQGLVSDCPRPLVAALVNRLVELRVASETLKTGRSFRIYPAELTTTGARNSYTLPLPSAGKQLFVGHHRGEHRVLHVASIASGAQESAPAPLALPDLGLRLTSPPGIDRLFVIYTVFPSRSCAYLACFTLRRE